MVKLAQQDGAAFDRTFMSLSVAGHQRKIEMIDNELLPATKNAQLKAALTEMRQTLSKHLELAKQVEGTDRVSTRRRSRRRTPGSGRARSRGRGCRIVGRLALATEAVDDTDQDAAPPDVLAQVQAEAATTWRSRLARIIRDG